MAQMGHNATWDLGMRLQAALLHQQGLLISFACKGCMWLYRVYSTSTRGTPVSHTHSHNIKGEYIVMYSHRKLTIEYREVCNSGRVLVEILPRDCLPPFTPCPIEMVMHGPWLCLSTVNVSKREQQKRHNSTKKHIKRPRSFNTITGDLKELPFEFLTFDDLFQLILPTSAQCHYYFCHCPHDYRKYMT